jgi:hypothetical protein
MMMMWIAVSSRIRLVTFQMIIMTQSLTRIAMSWMILYDKLVDKYKDAKSCKEFKEALELLDMTYDEYMQELEDEHQEYVDTCGGV